MNEKFHQQVPIEGDSQITINKSFANPPNITYNQEEDCHIQLNIINLHCS